MSSDAERIAQLEAQVAQLTEQCTAARTELEAFSYAVSHDLRAPLRSLSGFSQALLELPAASADEKAQHYLGRIQQASRRMAELIDALLTLSRISRADMQVRTIDFSQLCAESAKAIAPHYPDRTVQVTIAPGMTVMGDSRLLRAAMDALLDNAFKFTDAGSGHIQIGCANGVYFVRDNGVGFDMAYAEKLFRPFQRLHAEAQYPGIGIGLASVQRIMGRHGARVWAEAAPKQGASIFFSFPS